VSRSNFQEHSSDERRKKVRIVLIRLKDALFMWNQEKDLKRTKAGNPLTTKEENSLEKLIDLVPMTSMIWEEPTKKDKPPTKYAFALNNSQKRWRTVFAVEIEDAIEKSIFLATPTIFN